MVGLVVAGDAGVVDEEVDAVGSFGRDFADKTLHVVFRAYVAGGER